LLFRPLPFREPERLVWIASDAGKASGSLVVAEGNLSGVTTQVGNFSDWRSTNQSFEDLAGYFAFLITVATLSPAAVNRATERRWGIQNFLDLLGATESGADSKTMNAYGTARAPCF